MRQIISIKKWLIPCLMLTIAQVGYAQRFTHADWWGCGSMNFSSYDECRTIFRVSCGNSNDAHVQILEDGLALGQSDIVQVGTAVLRFQAGDGGEPAWRLIGDNITFYLNTRVKPYEISTSVPTNMPEVDVVNITTNKSLLTSPEESFELSAVGCSSVDTAKFTYQWMVSTDNENWSEVSGATSETLTLSGLKLNEKIHETLYYALKANVIYTDVDKELTSSSIKVSYKQPTVGGLEVNNSKGKTFNSKEFEISSFSDITSIKVISDEAGFTDDVEYCLSVKSLEKVDAEWEVIECGTSKEWKNFKPEGSALYRVAVKGKSVYSGAAAEVSSEETVVIRVVHRADSNFVEENLWLDDFGMFASATSYYAKDSTGKVKLHDGSIDGKSGEANTIENYWAPDPFNYVKEHAYGLTDPNVINPSRDWCGKYRLDDGYYIITSSPYYGDGPNRGGGQDYWKGEDHTSGDTDGGMLFVNCAAGKQNTLIYERDIYLNGTCENVELLFSCFICNAVFKDGSNVPVNLRLDLLDEKGSLVHSVSTGDIQRREQTLGTTLPPSEWANLTFKFPIEGSKYTMQLYNNALGGNANGGNDILIDDISISICYPTIELQAGVINPETGKVDTTTTDVQACLGETFQLHAFNEYGIKNFITNPRYLFQYKNASTEGKWVNYGEIGDDNIINISTKKKDATFLEKTTFRVIVAANDKAIDEILKYGSMDLDCDNMYAINEALTIVVNDPVVELQPDNSLYCLHDDKATPAELKAKIVSGTPKALVWGINDEIKDSIDCGKEDSVGTFMTINIDEVKSGDVYFARLVDKHCGVSENSTLSLSTADQVVLDIEVSDSKIGYGESVTLTVESSNASIDSFLWYGNGEKIESTVGEYELEYQPTKNGTFEFFADVDIADKRCASPSDTVLVEVSLKIPNIITPHNDYNDKSRNNSFMKGYQVEIYNRYQQMIFEGPDGWDATYRGETAEPGTYYYRLFLPDGTIRKGTLEVAKF